MKSLRACGFVAAVRPPDLGLLLECPWHRGCAQGAGAWCHVHPGVLRSRGGADSLSLGLVRGGPARSCSRPQTLDPHLQGRYQEGGRTGGRRRDPQTPSRASAETGRREWGSEPAWESYSTKLTFTKRVTKSSYIFHFQSVRTINIFIWFSLWAGRPFKF